MRTAVPEITVVVPVHAEAGNVTPLYERLSRVLDAVTDAWEILFVDDGSPDATLEVVRGIAEGDDRVGAVSFSRNFGKEVAIAAGLDEARGAAVVIMDADLQHPPEVVARFVELWRQGYDMVYAQRSGREGEGPIRRGFARLFYRLFARFGETTLPEGAGDFRLIDRKGVDVLRGLGERARFSKGLYAWIGFRSVGIPYVVADRHEGTSKWRFRKLLRFAFDGITSFSVMPLKVSTYVGGLVALGSMAVAAYFIAKTLVMGSDVPGYASLMVSISFFSGVQLLSLGIIGEYVGRIFDEVKGRPLYVVAERLGPFAPRGGVAQPPRARQGAGGAAHAHEAEARLPRERAGA